MGGHGNQPFNMSHDIKRLSADFDVLAAQYPDLAREILEVLTRDLPKYAKGYSTHDTHSLINQVWEYFMRKLGPIIRAHEQNVLAGTPGRDRGFLLVTAINRIRRILRTVDRTRELPPDVVDKDSEEVQSFGGELMERLDRVFGSLPKNYQAILILNEMKGVPYEKLVPHISEFLKEIPGEPMDDAIARLTDLKRRALGKLHVLLSQAPTAD
jgi:hypothetical protein